MGPSWQASLAQWHGGAKLASQLGAVAWRGQAGTPAWRSALLCEDQRASIFVGGAPSLSHVREVTWVCCWMSFPCQCLLGILDAQCGA